MKKTILFFSLCLLQAFTAWAQTSSLNGVYVGAELFNTPFNGVQIEYIVLDFRSNGTFNDKLNQRDWRTRVAGNYKVAGGMVQLNFKSGGEGKRYKLSANGNLQSTAGVRHTLHKIKKVASVPAGVYESRSASTSGGIGSGQPMVGAFASNVLYFDGKGHFATDRSSIVGVGGEAVGGTIGGKFEHNAKTSGTYKMGDGEITLTYGNGNVTKHTFFYSPPNQEDLVLVDGEFYFRDEKGVLPNTATRASSSTDNTSSRSSASNTSSANGMPSATVLLTKLRAQYGGANIDKINTIREISTLSGGMQAVVITDILNNRVRAEVTQNGKLLLVKQLDGSQGWQWLRGTKKVLTQDEKDELALGFYQGTIGLHKKLYGLFQSGTVTASGGDYIVTFYHNKNKVVYLLGSDYSMKGNAYNLPSGTTMSIYRDFVSKNGITYPSTTQSSDGKTTLTATTTSFEINPALTAENWKTP